MRLTHVIVMRRTVGHFLFTNNIQQEELMRKVVTYKRSCFIVILGVVQD